MYTTYHLSSAQEINTDILDAIKATFKSKAITIIVEDDEEAIELTSEMKDILNERLQEDPQTYLTSKESIEKLTKKHDL